MKPKEELQELKEEYEALNKKLAELSEEELQQVVGGVEFDVPKIKPDYEHEFYKGEVVNDFEPKF